MVLLAACQPQAVTPTLPIADTAFPSPTTAASPSPIPITPEPTKTIPPAPLDFTEQFDGPLPYWTYQQVDNGQAPANLNLDGGFLVFDLTGPNEWVYSLYGVSAYTDVRVDVQTQFRTGGTGALGIVCRYSEEQGWYELNIFADQTYDLLYGQWLTPGVARYTPLFRDSSDKIKGDANEIGLICKGDTLVPFINGVQMRTWQENKIGLKEGRIGISAASFENVPMTIAYDWVKVSEP